MLGVGVGYSCCLNFVSVPKRTTISLQYYVKGGMGGGGGESSKYRAKKNLICSGYGQEKYRNKKRERERESGGGAETEEETDKLTDGGLTEVHRNKDRIKEIHFLKDQQ